VSEPRDALEAIGQLPEGEIDIADAALQLARIDAPEADWLTARAHLSELARKAAASAASWQPTTAAARAGILRDVLFEDEDYRGDDETYEDLANANLIHVINRRRGLPVALGILWIHCARAAGWVAHGVDFPAHFVIALEGQWKGTPSATPAVLDVFSGGRVLDARDLRKLLDRVEGPAAPFRPEMLKTMDDRAVLLRLQNNIVVRRLHVGNLAGSLACLEDMLRIAPAAANLWQEAAWLNRRLERLTGAIKCFERYLELAPDSPMALSARAAMDELRARLA
jgi:regulator of sirC expression with transglutaminase-like and TPR domain